MDVILYNKMTKLDDKINTVSDETESKFTDMVSVIAGYDFMNPILTENYFANYNAATTHSFSGCNIVEFDVTQIVKFKYLYTIGTPDNRGMYFVDKNNTFLSGYQTLATQQNITVPSGAVKCCASVNSIYDISPYDIVSERPVEILKKNATYTNKDNSGGIKYQWSQDHSTITISGTRTGNNFDTMAGGSNKMPTGMVAGKPYKFVVNIVNTAIRVMCLIYVDGTQISQHTVTSTHIWTIPEGTTGLEIRFTVYGANAVVNETVPCPEIYTVPDVKSISERLDDLENAAYGSTTNPLAYIHKDAGLLSIFHTVGCIGDSLASGASAYKQSGEIKYTDNYDFSWGQCLARLTGNTYYNFSKGGLSSRSWLASTYATECFDGNHKCDMYFLGLGQNDKNGSIPVGTIADIDLEDYTQNEDTYCGNMGQIIQRLQILQPKAPIFVFIDPNPPSNDQSYNNVIEDIVDLFDNVWIIDLKTYARQMFTEGSYIIGSQYRSGHYSAVGYQEIAYVISTYVDWIIKHNLNAFNQVEFIGTNYEWTD